MNFTLIICTYMRPKPLLDLLNSVKKQSLYPDEILIIDGSTNDETNKMLSQNIFQNLVYYKVSESERGLTKQRNYGIARAAESSEIICFLDDDTILDGNYFKELISTYLLYPNALGVGGYIENEATWYKTENNYTPKFNDFFYDGWKRREGLRYKVRKFFGLDSDKKPGFLPEFGNGRSVGFLPPSGKIYEVEQLKGGVSSFKKSVFEKIKFSTYFEGYGLYEDADFTLRLSKIGKLYLNTNARLGHFHNASGRVNKFKYGRMVVKNGWYIWRVKYPNPSFKNRVKWNIIVVLLSFLLLKNILNIKKSKSSINEFLGRITAWFLLIFSKK